MLNERPAYDVPKVEPPEPYRGLGLVWRNYIFWGWVTFWGWQPRYLLVENWLLASVAGEWLSEKEFAEHVGLSRPERYRVEWIA